MAEQRISCRDALEQLWEYIDRELDDATAAQIRSHLERCGHCFPKYDFQRAFRDFMAASCRECAPPELRRRIFLELLDEASRGA